LEDRQGKLFCLDYNLNFCQNSENYKGEICSNNCRLVFDNHSAAAYDLVLDAVDNDSDMDRF